MKLLDLNFILGSTLWYHIFFWFFFAFFGARRHPGVSDDSADGARTLFWRFLAKSFPRETLYLRSNTVEICDFLLEERNLVSGLKHSGDPTTKNGTIVS